MEANANDSNKSNAKPLLAAAAFRGATLIPQNSIVVCDRPGYGLAHRHSDNQYSSGHVHVRLFELWWRELAVTLSQSLSISAGHVHTKGALQVH